jgi:hypothetical protein
MMRMTVFGRGNLMDHLIEARFYRNLGKLGEICRNCNFDRENKRFWKLKDMQHN